MAGVDSLPYHDTLIDKEEGLRERLEQEIEQEIATLTAEEKEALASRLPAELPPLFQGNDFLAAELKRLQGKGKTKGGLDSVRYSLPVPPASAPLEAWKKALDNAASQLEHQRTRISNLDLLGKYGSNSWRTTNFLMDKEIDRLKQRNEEVIRRTEELNRERKAKQVEAGSQLTALETRWNTLVSGNIQLELATLQLELEVETLREREAELKSKMEELQVAQ